MLRKLKKILFVVPLMILGLFIFEGTKTMAAEAQLLSGTSVADSVVVGAAKKENKYYFSNSPSWELKVVDYNIGLWDWDTYLKWRVVRPDGKATAWSKPCYYPDNKGKFNIGDYTRLSYVNNVDISTRNSVAPKMTYYIDIQYYSELIWSTHQEEKDETIKVIVSGNDDSLNRPTLDISYNKTANSFTIKTGVPDYSIITGIAYFFSNDNLTIGTQNDFYKELQKSNERGTLLKTPSDEVSVTLKNSATSYRFLYVISETGNGYATISSYDMTPPSGGNSGGQNTNTSTNPNYTQTSTDDSNGVFDLPIGHVILIVLVIVLIVSCALIITQKIVDYKKRLY